MTYFAHSDRVQRQEKPSPSHWHATEEQSAAFHFARANRPFRQQPVILLVEDQRFFQQVFRSALGIHQLVLIAADAKQGWQLYLEHAPDLAFLDVRMEGISGHELAIGLHALDADAFLVMLTAANDIENIAEADENGAREYITKPYSQKKLLDCLARFYAERQKR